MAVAIEDFENPDRLDPTYPARAHASQMLNLPYVASIKQLEFHLHPATTMAHPLLYGGAMGGGKSAGICAEAIRECLEVEPNRVLLARKELVTFKRTTMETLIGLMPDNVTHRPSANMFIFPNGSQLIYTGLGTEKERQKLRSSEYGSIFIDEATEIDKPTFIEAGTRLRWRPADAVHRLKLRLTCNPEPGWIKEDFVGENRNPGYYYIPARPVDNPHLPASYVNDMRQSLPTEQYRAYMLGDWDALQPTNIVLDALRLEKAFRRHGVAGSSCVWGLDVARFGKDKTVLMARRGWQFRWVNRWEKLATDKIVDSVVTQYLIAELKPDAINVDDDGVGGGVTDGLRRKSLDGLLGGCTINAVIAQGQARDTDHYANMKSELWFSFKRALEADEPIDLPAEPSMEAALLKGDLAIHRYEVRNGKAWVEPKRLVKARQGHSPDDGDALILTMYQGRSDYVAYESEEERRERMLQGLTEVERLLILHSEAQRKARRGAMETFARRYGITLPKQTDETEDVSGFPEPYDPYDLGY